jgi:hypothetical protein
MKASVGSPIIGQWYSRTDKGENFVVTGIDDEAGTIEIQSFDGDLDELDRDIWRALPLELAEEPEDSTGPVEVEPDDLGYAETGMSPADWNEPLQPLKVEKEAWEYTTPVDELPGEGVPLEEPGARVRKALGRQAKPDSAP